MENNVVENNNGTKMKLKEETTKENLVVYGNEYPMLHESLTK